MRQDKQNDLRNVKCTGENEQPRPLKITRPTRAAKAKDIEKMSNVMINKYEE